MSDEGPPVTTDDAWLTDSRRGVVVASDPSNAFYGSTLMLHDYVRGDSKELLTLPPGTLLRSPRMGHADESVYFLQRSQRSDIWTIVGGSGQQR